MLNAIIQHIEKKASIRTIDTKMAELCNCARDFDIDNYPTIKRETGILVEQLGDEKTTARYNNLIGFCEHLLYNRPYKPKDNRDASQEVVQRYRDQGPLCFAYS